MRRECNSRIGSFPLSKARLHGPETQLLEQQCDTNATNVFWIRSKWHGHGCWRSGDLPHALRTDVPHVHSRPHSSLVSDARLCRTGYLFLTFRKPDWTFGASGREPFRISVLFCLFEEIWWNLADGQKRAAEMNDD